MIEDSSLSLIRARRKLLKLEREISRHKNLTRKEDARHKIELGGLVIKGGLDQESKAIILGAIIAAKNEMMREPAYRKFLKLLGENSFLGHEA